MSQNEERVKRHHLVPRNYLRGWAGGDGRVKVLDVLTGQTFVSNVANVALQSNFFTFDTEEGPTDRFERMLSEVEGRAAPILERVRNCEWPISDDDRGDLANLIALQIARRPSFRKIQSEGVTKLMRMVGKMIAAHPDALRDRFRETEGRDPTEDELQRVAEALSSNFNANVPRNHWAEMFAIASECVEAIFAMRWTRAEAKGSEFVTGDEPFVPWKHPAAPAWTSAGLLTARLHTFPLCPRFCLMLDFVHNDQAVIVNPGDIAIILAKDQVDAVNLVTTVHADRHVIMRRDFDWSLPSGSDGSNRTSG